MLLFNHLINSFPLWHGVHNANFALVCHPLCIYKSHGAHIHTHTHERKKTTESSSYNKCVKNYHFSFCRPLLALTFFKVRSVKSTLLFASNERVLCNLYKGWYIPKTLNEKKSRKISGLGILTQNVRACTHK